MKLMIAKSFSFIILSMFVVKASKEAESDSNESLDGDQRDRRGVYHHHHRPKNPYRVVPPLAAVAPLSIFAAKPTVIPVPAKLLFQKTFSGEEFEFTPFNRFESILNKNGYGFTPAIPQVLHQPVILRNHHQSTKPRFHQPQQRYQQRQPSYKPPQPSYKPPQPSYKPHVDRCSKSRFPCAAMVYCAPFYVEVVENSLGCHFQPDAFGACCRYPNPISGGSRGSGGRGRTYAGGVSNGPFRMFEPLRIVVAIPHISMYDLQAAEAFAFQALYNLDMLEIQLQRNDITVTDPQRPEYGHLQFFRTSVEAMKIARGALLHEFTGRKLADRFKLTPVQASFGLQPISTEGTRLPATCPPPPTCTTKDQFYRTADGSCNNIFNPSWGRARTQLERIVPPRYFDGVSEPRRSVTGARLPSARLVSAANVPDVDRPSREFTLSVMQWGQFIDHDLTQVPIKRFDNETGIECCDTSGRLIPDSARHPECLPIEIPSDDYFYARFGRRCMNFVRSLAAPNANCTLGPRDQMNQVSHFLDGSNVYGSSSREEANLRAHTGGLLKEQGSSLLPIDPFIRANDCFLNGTGLGCFLAGDNRVNEQPHLSILHTIWLRQHNQIARELARANPHWDDETLYHETRRIIVAKMQHIIYNEWLPIIIGTDTVERSGLLPLREGFSSSYNGLINAAIRNEFASIAFRFGHSLVQGQLGLFDHHHRLRDEVPLHTEFNKPRILYHNFDALLRGLFKTPIQSFDNNVVDDLTNRLFQTDSMPFGLDLIALNTQRAREHGVGTYNDLREACGLRRATEFHHLRDFIRPENLAIFRNIYASVDDVDPFVAGISEAPVNGGLLGPLFSCIIRDQFARLKFGDRFFYENGGMPTSFTEAQLFEIKKCSWAGVICGNSDGISKIQPLAFRLPGPNNEKVPCDSPTIPKMDLTPWISAQGGTSGFSS